LYDAAACQLLATSDAAIDSQYGSTPQSLLHRTLTQRQLGTLAI
jgi:hypothetical protein